MFEEPDEKTLIIWAEWAIESAKNELSRKNYSEAKGQTLAAISYLQDVCRELNKKES